MITLRSYEPERDARPAYALWQQTLGQLWPLPFNTFHTITVANPAYQPADHVVACSGEELVGLLAMQVRRDTTPVQGHVLALLVAPAFQRQGIGRRLHEHALRRYIEQGVAQVQLGGGLLYFWQGVPFNLPVAWAFFQAQGWQEQEHSFDLVRTLADYTTPAWVYKRLAPTITIEQASASESAAILAFEEQHFPGWFPYYQHTLSLHGAAEVVIAREASQGIVGTAQMVDPQAPGWRKDIRWLSLLGATTGGVGVLGVAEPMREQGIGLALAARVTELLRERGLRTCYIGWTWLVDWYGKLGYQIWQSYHMSWRKV